MHHKHGNMTVTVPHSFGKWEGIMEGAMEVKRDYESYNYISSACNLTTVGFHRKCFPVSSRKFLRKTI